MKRYTITFENTDQTEALRLASGWFQAFTFTPGNIGAWQGTLESSATITILGTADVARLLPAQKHRIATGSLTTDVATLECVHLLAVALRDALEQDCVLLTTDDVVVDFI